MRIVNLAHGSYFMLGGYVGLSVVWRTGSFLAALVAGAVAIALIGIGMERLFLRRLPGQTLGQVLMTVGFALMFQDVALLVWGGDPYTIPVPAALQGIVTAGTLRFPAYRIFIIFVAVLVGAGLWVVLDRTRVGAMIRAAVDDREMAQGVGIHVPVVSLGVFALGAALAALGGVIGGGFLGVYPGADFEVLPYPFTLLTQAVIVAILAMSLDVLLGYTGLPSLGHAAYFGIAAYTVGILATERQTGLAGCLVAALLLATATAAVFGFLAIRATGTYFLMITLALGMVVWGLAFRWVSMTKRDNGIAGLPRPELGLPWSLAAPLPFFYFALLAAALAWAAMGVLVRSPFGLGLKGIRESESRMRALGYNVWLHKYLAFVISGFFAAFAGVLWAYYNGFVGPVDVQLVTSVETLLMVALGGPGTLAGSAFGAVAIVFLQNFVCVYTKRLLLILGAVYIGVILFAPRGVLGAFSREPRGAP